MTPPVADAALVAALEPVVGRVRRLDREPYAYATSFRLERIDAALANGTALALLLKDLSWVRLLDEAARIRDPAHHEPRREIEMYRRVLGPAGIGARCYGASTGPHPWLLLERVDAVELWQVGDLEVWEQVAVWLARFHLSFVTRVDDLHADVPFLRALDTRWFEVCRQRARVALHAATDPRAAELVGLLDALGDEVARELADVPATLVHGELYPSNVLVRADDRVRVCPVDWEVAASGPAYVDLAALVSGWDEEGCRRITAAYEGALGAGTASVTGGIEPARLLEDCRLHLALQWLGWGSGWRAPTEHAQDWVGEALAAARRLAG